MAASTQHFSISTSSSGDLTVAAAVQDKRIVVLSYVVINSVATAQNVTWKSGSTALSGAIGLPSSIGGGIAIASQDPCPVLATAKSQALILTVGAATAIAGHVSFRYE
jgi:hypothetical protein